MPLQVNGGMTLAKVNINITSVPHDHFLTAEQVAAIEGNRELLPAVVDPELQRLYDLDHSAKELIGSPKDDPDSVA
jgi:hypothetical protein